MSMKDDMDALERHLANGTAKDFIAGTQPPTPIDQRLPLEDQRQPSETPFQFIARRGD